MATSIPPAVYNKINAYEKGSTFSALIGAIVLVQWQQQCNNEIPSVTPQPTIQCTMFNEWKVNYPSPQQSQHKSTVPEQSQSISADKPTSKPPRLQP